MNYRIFAVILVISNIGVCHAQSRGALSSPLADTVFAWTTGKWDGNDKPYKLIRDGVLAAMEKSKSPASLAAEYKAQAAEDPHNPHLAFQYAYGVYEARVHDPALRNSPEIYSAERAIKEVIQPHTYQFARLEFLIEAELGAAGRVLLPLGKRLLQRDPSDIQVKYQMVNLLDPSNYPEDSAEKKVYAQDLVKAFPKSSSMYALLGLTYFEIWQRTKTQSAKEQALAAFQKYLQLAPPYENYRKHVQFTMKWIETGHIPT